MKRSALRGYLKRFTPQKSQLPKGLCHEVHHILRKQTVSAYEQDTPDRRRAVKS